MSAYPADLGNQLRSDAFRPIATIVVPGATAISPYLLVAAIRYPALRSVIDAYPLLASVVVFFMAVAAGMVLEDIGPSSRRVSGTHVSTPRRSAKTAIGTLISPSATTRSP